MKFWFEDRKRLLAAKIFQQERIRFLENVWSKDRDLKAAGFSIEDTAIQLAGRIWRHRPQKTAKEANLVILDRNIKALTGAPVAFTKPGFEEETPTRFLLKTHHCRELISQPQLNRVDATARVSRSDTLDPQTSLADLEHAVMANLLNNSDNFVSAFWRQHNGNRAKVVHCRIGSLEVC